MLIVTSKTLLFEIVLLGAASQRIEYLALEFIGLPWMLEILADWKEHERGSIPGPTECCIIMFIISESINVRHDTNLIQLIINNLCESQV